MPYITLTAIAYIGNLYTRNPIVVGDKDSNEELMDYLGAKPTKQYPSQNSPTVYIVEDIPRNLLNILEKKGYRLISSQIHEEHYIWTMYKPRDVNDSYLDLKEGPNDKKCQTDKTCDEMNKKLYFDSENDQSKESSHTTY